MNATMNLRERNNSGDCAQLWNNSFGVSATGGSCMLRCALRLISRLSSLVLCANPDRTWQITYGLSWIFLFLPAEIRKETGNDGAEDVAREVHARWKRVILSRRGNESLKQQSFFRFRSASAVLTLLWLVGWQSPTRLYFYYFTSMFYQILIRLDISLRLSNVKLFYP